jgi:hypothetical protein
MAEGQTGGSAGESDKERVDRELIELLNEIRVALPGVQVLFAFLLTVPFQSGYTKLTDFHKDLMLMALIASAISIVLLVAPTAQHRILFRQANKEGLLFHANRLLLAGTMFLAFSITIAVFVVTDIFIDRLAASIAAAGLSLLFVLFWYAMPIWIRIRT